MGVSYKFIAMLKNLYTDNTRRIKWQGGITPPITVNRGVRQGCPLSPLLFSLYITHIPAKLDAKCHGTILLDTKVTNLFYADDVVLISESRTDMLQALQTLNIH